MALNSRFESNTEEDVPVMSPTWPRKVTLTSPSREKELPIEGVHCLCHCLSRSLLLPVSHCLCHGRSLSLHCRWHCLCPVPVMSPTWPRKVKPEQPAPPDEIANLVSGSGVGFPQLAGRLWLAGWILTGSTIVRPSSFKGS